MSAIRDLLLRTRQLLTCDWQWTQRAYAKRAQEGMPAEPCDVLASGPVCRCLVGGLLAGAGITGTACDATRVVHETAAVLAALIPGGRDAMRHRNVAPCSLLIEWNDHPTRTHREVLALVDEGLEVTKGDTGT